MMFHNVKFDGITLLAISSHYGKLLSNKVSMISVTANFCPVHNLAHSHGFIHIP